MNNESNKTILRYRELLCNFSKLNKELYYKESAISLPLSKISFSNDFKNKKTVLEKFKPASFKDVVFNESLGKGKINLSSLFFLNVESNKLIERKINKLRLIDDEYQKEFGMSGAWFIGPFLLWRAKDMNSPNDILISPIFKIAIDIKKSKNKDDELVLENEVFTINPSLRLYLKKEFGINLQEEYEGDLTTVLDLVRNEINSASIKLEDLTDYTDLIRIPPTYKTIEDADGNSKRVKVNPDEYLNDVEKSIYSKVSLQNFFLHDVAYVDYLSANKMALYNDYEEIIKNNDIQNISDLVLGIPNPAEKSLATLSIDDLPEHKNFFVVDIDSSQHVAINKALSQRALVIQGPPGTGKSQTITNMISQFMSEGKKVLFVAEKRAALDVVHSRLKQSNLSKQSVIIHSSDLDRKSLYKSFVDILKEEPSKAIESNWNKVSTELDSTKKSLNNYFKDLKKVHLESGKVHSEIFSMNSKYLKHGMRPGLKNFFKSFSLEKLECFKSTITQIENYYNSFPGYFDSKWIKKKTNFIFTETNKFEFEENYTALMNDLNDFDQLKNKFYQMFPESDFSKLKYINIQRKNSFDSAFTSALVNNYKKQELYKQVIEKMQAKLVNLKDSFGDYCKIREDADEEMVKNLSLYYAKPRGFSDCFTLKFWSMRKLKKIVAKAQVTLVNNIEFSQWLKFRKEKIEIEEMLGELKNIFPIQTNSERFQESYVHFSSNLIATSSIVENLQLLGGKRLQDELKGQDVIKLNEDLITAEEIYKKLIQLEGEIQKRLAYFSEVSGLQISFSVDKDNNDLEIVHILNTSKDEVIKVHKMKEIVSNFETEANVKSFEEIILSSLRHNENWYEQILSQCVKRWHDEVLDMHPSLQSFDSVILEQNIEKIKDLFLNHQLIARESLNSILAGMKSKNDISLKAIKLLETESSKQRRIKSPREVMEAGALEAMLSIKRCWLMSPLSISQILPNIQNLFDVVIFDEASQVRIEDALPSIFRAKNLIVVGDNKQMPPTNFFGGGMTSDEDEGDVELGESVLDQAVKSYEDVMLEWHYRSKALALIEFSNYAFYDKKLIAVPNPGSLVSGKPIEFISVENGYFTSKEGNMTEAKIIALEVSKVLKANKKASIGVIAMGMSQQKAIEEEILELAEKDADFNEAYNFSLRYEENGAVAGFFNKNLENVQGDERDLILISIGYAKPNEKGKLRQMFGPLSTNGGGRRLNVAATRAKEKMKIFCSFDIGELAIDDKAFLSNKETTTFARFLHYCKSVSDQNQQAAQDILSMFSNAKSRTSDVAVTFNLEVKAELEQKGYKIVENAGSCGFFLDLAVIDPDDSDNYLIGIECDGAIFHTAEYARDRNKSRESLLLNRGWEMHRVWSQDWSRDREKELDKIIKAISEAKSKKYKMPESA